MKVNKMNENSNKQQKHQSKFFNKNKERSKFTPQFKKKLPTWKQIEQEIKNLQPKYDLVSFSFCLFIFFKILVEYSYILYIFLKSRLTRIK